MKKTLLFGFIAVLVTIFSLAVAPIAEAASAPIPDTVDGTCSAKGQSGQSLGITGSRFEIEGTATVANYSDADLSPAQTLKEGKIKSQNVGDSIDFNLFKFFHVTFSASHQSTQTWGVGQTLGPYPVKPGHTGVLEYGFLNRLFEGAHLTCRGGKWVDAGRPYQGTIPKERHIRASMRANETDRFMDGAASQVKEYVA